MATQMTSARRGIATDEMKQVAKDEDVTLDWLISKIASGSIIIPSNNVRKEKIHNVGIGKGMKTKVNVCLLYTSPSPRDLSTSRMPSSA